MVMIKASQESEAGMMPSEELLTAMGRYNEELVQAGVLQAGEGLQPSAKGARVKFSGSQRTVIDGPFSETKELIAGFWIFQVKSLQEAIEWVKRCPNPMPGESEIEIRQVFEAEDFGAEFTPEDVYAGNLLGAYAAGQGGITTLCDESHVQNSPGHSDAAIGGLADAGIRAVFDYGWPSVDAESWLRDSRREHPDYIRTMLKDDRWTSNP
ncbi:MAG: YciI family protein, partial [Oceanisphaera sp.]|nr:YciI family protein [Oceanisphaera sp.]